MEQRASRALEFTAWHCIVSQQSVYLCAVRLNRVMRTLVPTLNFNLSRSLSYRQFYEMRLALKLTSVMFCTTQRRDG
jgi:hypothetical protein